MGTALKRWKEYRASAYWSKYDSYAAAICDDGYEDDILPDGDACYTLHHYRRASFIVWRAASGGHYATEYPNESAANEAWESIRSEIDNAMYEAANEAHPDRWVVRVPTNYPYAFESCSYCKEDAEDAICLVLDQIKAQQDKGAAVVVMLYGFDDTDFEVFDDDDAVMVSPLVGRYFIDHIDNSEARERFIEQSYYC